jgi:hypothetical protein
MSELAANFLRSYQACAPQPIAAKRTFELRTYFLEEKLHAGMNGNAPAAKAAFKKDRLSISAAPLSEY